MVEFRVLGPLEVRSGESTVDIGGTEPKRLLAHLIASANSELEADTLVELLWGDDPPESARNSIRTAVARLRGVVGSDLIQETDAGYRLVVAPANIDLVRFETLVTEARALAEINPTRSAEAFAEAEELWRGSPFEDVDVTGRPADIAGRLVDLRLTAIEDRVAVDLTRPDGAVVVEVESLVAEHPERVRLWGVLISSLVAEGRGDEAGEVYERAAAVVDEAGRIDLRGRLTVGLAAAAWRAAEFSDAALPTAAEFADQLEWAASTSLDLTDDEREFLVEVRANRDARPAVPEAREQDDAPEAPAGRGRIRSIVIGIAAVIAIIALVAIVAVSIL